MRPTTTTALALAGTALALPAGVAPAAAEDPPQPNETTIAAPFLGHTSTNARLHAERREALAKRYTPRVIRIERQVAKLRDETFHAGAHRKRLRSASIGELRVELRRSRRALRRLRSAAAAASTASPNLEAIAACESGGDPSANTGNGFYGKFQFTQQTWESVGGTGNPAAASEAEQNKRAAMLYAQQGSSPWPVCGR
jgi:hypothetical protein